jgi:hypothetical protein
MCSKIWQEAAKIDAADAAAAAAAAAGAGAGAATAAAAGAGAAAAATESESEYVDWTPQGPKFQAEIPELRGTNDLHVHGVVEPQPLDDRERRIEATRHIDGWQNMIKNHPERCRDSPSPPPGKKRPPPRRKRSRSGAGAAARRAGASAGPRDPDPMQFAGHTRGFSKENCP